MVEAVCSHYKYRNAVVSTCIVVAVMVILKLCVQVRVCVLDGAYIYILLLFISLFYLPFSFSLYL